MIPRRPSTSGELQPSVDVMVSDAVNATREATASSWPRRSGRVAAWRGISAVRAAMRAIDTAETGTTTRKTERQPSAATSHPPITGPAVRPMPETPPQIPSARALATGSG